MCKDSLRIRPARDSLISLNLVSVGFRKNWAITISEICWRPMFSPTPPRRVCPRLLGVAAQARSCVPGLPTFPFCSLNRVIPIPLSSSPCFCLQSLSVPLSEANIQGSGVVGLRIATCSCVVTSVSPLGSVSVHSLPPPSLDIATHVDRGDAEALARRPSTSGTQHWLLLALSL